MVKSSEGKPRSDKNSEVKNKSKSRMTVSPVVRFVVLFLVLIVVVSVLFSQVFTRFHDQMLWLMEITATIVGSTLSVFSDHVEYSGVFVYYHGFSVEIIDECTGLFEMLLYIAAVLSFSTTWRKKLIGLLMGSRRYFFLT